MALYTVEGIATLAVGTNLIANEPWTIAPFPRVLRSIGYVGSVNPMDCSAEILIGVTSVSRFFNSTGGNNIAPHPDTDMFEIGEIIPPNVPISVPIRVASVTNQTVLTVDIANLPGRRR